MGQDFQYSLLGLVELLQQNPAKTVLGSVIPINFLSAPGIDQIWGLSWLSAGRF